MSQLFRTRRAASSLVTPLEQRYINDMLAESDSDESYAETNMPVSKDSMHVHRQISILLHKNKITHQNAFTVAMPNTLHDWVKDQLTDYQWKSASHSFDNMQRLYSFRVDATHSAVNRIVSLISYREKEQNTKPIQHQSEVRHKEAASKEMEWKGFKRYIESNSLTLNAENRAQFGVDEVIERLRRQFDQSAISSLFLNRLKVGQAYELQLITRKHPISPSPHIRQDSLIPLSLKNLLASLGRLEGPNFQIPIGTKFESTETILELNDLLTEIDLMLPTLTSSINQTNQVSKSNTKNTSKDTIKNIPPKMSKIADYVNMEDSSQLLHTNKEGKKDKMLNKRHLLKQSQADIKRETMQTSNIQKVTREDKFNTNHKESNIYEEIQGSIQQPLQIRQPQKQQPQIGLQEDKQSSIKSFYRRITTQRQPPISAELTKQTNSPLTMQKVSKVCRKDEMSINENQKNQKALKFVDIQFQDEQNVHLVQERDSANSQKEQKEKQSKQIYSNQYQRKAEVQLIYLPIKAKLQLVPVEIEAPKESLKNIRNVERLLPTSLTNDQISQVTREGKIYDELGDERIHNHKQSMNQQTHIKNNSIIPELSVILLSEPINQNQEELLETDPNKQFAIIPNPNITHLSQVIVEDSNEDSSSHTNQDIQINHHYLQQPQLIGLISTEEVLNNALDQANLVENASSNQQEQPIQKPKSPQISLAANQIPYSQAQDFQYLHSDINEQVQENSMTSKMSNINQMISQPCHNIQFLERSILKTKNQPTNWNKSKSKQPIRDKFLISRQPSTATEIDLEVTLRPPHPMATQTIKMPMPKTNVELFEQWSQLPPPPLQLSQNIQINTKGAKQLLSIMMISRPESFSYQHALDRLRESDPSTTYSTCFVMLLHLANESGVIYQQTGPCEFVLMNRGKGDFQINQNQQVAIS